MFPVRSFWNSQSPLALRKVPWASQVDIFWGTSTANGLNTNCCPSIGCSFSNPLTSSAKSEIHILRDPVINDWSTTHLCLCPFLVGPTHPCRCPCRHRWKGLNRPKWHHWDSEILKQLHFRKLTWTREWHPERLFSSSRLYLSAGVFPISTLQHNSADVNSFGNFDQEPPNTPVHTRRSIMLKSLRWYDSMTSLRLRVCTTRTVTHKHICLTSLWLVLFLSRWNRSNRCFLDPI